jgi:hypothetical protein
MTGPATAAAASTVEYTITYTNSSGDNGGDDDNGDDDDDCEIDDLMPDDVSYVSSKGGGVYDSASRTVTWHTGPVAAGASRSVSVTATVSPFAVFGTVITNMAYFGGLGIGTSPLAIYETVVVP